MVKYVRCINNFDAKELTMGEVYKVINVSEKYFDIEHKEYGTITRWKERFEEVETILDSDLQRVNNIVIGTLNYVSDKFEGEEEISISKLPYNKSLFLHGCNISIVKKNKGLSDWILFQSAQEAQEYIDKFTKIIDDININHHKNKPKYKINSDKLYTEDEISKLKELGIDFVEIN